MTHDSTHSLLLQAVAEGSRDRNDPEVSTLARACEPCRIELDEVLRIQHTLRRAARERDEVLEAARTESASPLDAVFELALRNAIAGKDETRLTVVQQSKQPSVSSEEVVLARRRSPRRFVPMGLIAAGIALAIGFTAWELKHESRGVPPEVFLSDRAIQLESRPRMPRDEIRFEWHAQLSPGTQITLLLEGREDEGKPWIGLRTLTTRDTEWIPSTAETRVWPKALRWRVIAKTPAGVVEAESDWSYVTISP